MDSVQVIPTWYKIPVSSTCVIYGLCDNDIVCLSERNILVRKKKYLNHNIITNILYYSKKIYLKSENRLVYRPQCNDINKH